MYSLLKMYRLHMNYMSALQYCFCMERCMMFHCMYGCSLQSPDVMVCGFFRVLWFFATNKTYHHNILITEILVLKVVLQWGVRVMALKHHKSQSNHEWNGTG